MITNESSNQDLFRGSLGTLDYVNVKNALLWANGLAPFPPPSSVHLDLTFRCTGHCIHCRQWTWPKHSEFTIDQLEKIFLVFEKWGVKALTFGGGNPLLHRNIIDAIHLAKNKNIQLGIISEGLRISDNLADAICDNAKWIRFSLDGPSSLVHDAIRNTIGLFDNVVRGIAKLRNKKSALRIGLNCIMQKSNINHLQQIVELANRIDVDVVLFKFPHGTEDRKNRYLPSREEWEQVFKWISVAIQHEELVAKSNLKEILQMYHKIIQLNDLIEGLPVRNFYIDNKIKCFAPLFFVSCDSEGNIYPCDYLQADTRSWGGIYRKMRTSYCAGNILSDDHQVLENLSNMVLNNIYSLPSNGFIECGCCTRFCQFNSDITKLNCDFIKKNASCRDNSLFNNNESNDNKVLFL